MSDGDSPNGQNVPVRVSANLGGQPFTQDSSKFGYGASMTQEGAIRCTKKNQIPGNATDWVYCAQPIVTEVPSEKIDQSAFAEATSKEAAGRVLLYKENYRFLLLRLSCGFKVEDPATLAGAPYAIAMGEMKLDLSCEGAGSAQAIAFDWQPKDTLSGYKDTTEVSIGGKAGLDKVFEIDPGFKDSREITVQQAEITCIGGLGRSLTWQYHTTKGLKKIEGEKDAWVIVAAPKDSRAVTAHVDVRAIVALNGKVDQIVQKLTGRPDVVGDVTVPSETRALLEAREKANDELLQEGYLQEIKYTKSAPPLKGRDLAKRPLRSGMDFKLI